MAEIVKDNLKYKHHFDKKTKRHYLNGTLTVLHCHHYTTLYSQLALDAGETEIIKECARQSIRDMLATYFENNPGDRTRETMAKLCCDYYAVLGMGKMQILNMGATSGKVTLLMSHLDAGWKKKWGTYDKPVNYITAGFIEAMFETVFDTAPKTFEAKEVQSIVMGAETSIFNVTRR